MDEATLMEQQFRICADKVDPAQSAAKQLAFDAIEGSRDLVGPDLPTLIAAETLAETFTAWGWQLKFDDHGNVCGIDGPDSGKILDETVLFEAVAPFVEQGSYIQVIYDEDLSIWRWIFSSGTCREVQARLVFSG